MHNISYFNTREDFKLADVSFLTTRNLLFNNVLLKKSTEILGFD